LQVQRSGSYTSIVLTTAETRALADAMEQLGDECPDRLLELGTRLRFVLALEESEDL